MLVELLARAQRGRHQVGVVGRPALARRLDGAGVRVWSVPMDRSIHPLRDARDLGRVVRIVRRFAPDVVHAHSSKAGVLGRVAGRLCGVPVVLSPHNFAHSIHEGPAWLRRAFLAVERALAPLTSHLHVTYEEEREDALRLGLARPGRVSVVPNGIDAGPLLALPPPTGEPPTVGTYARLWPQKRVDLLLRAAASVMESGADLRVAVVGEGPLRGELEALADTLGIAERTRFVDDPGGPARALALLDVFVLSSVQEAFPLTPMEAMAAGRPVVASRVGAVPEVVEDGVTGLLVDPGDEPGLAAALGRLVADPERREALGTAGRRVAGERFDVAAMAEALDEIYRAAAGESGPPVTARPGSASGPAAA